MKENNEVSNLDLSVGPSFKDYMHITRLLEQRSIKISNMHKESDLGSVVDKYISQLFDEILIFFSDPKSLYYEIRENEIISSGVHLPTYSTVCKDPDFEIKGDEVMPNDFHLVTYPSRDIDDMKKITPNSWSTERCIEETHPSLPIIPHTSNYQIHDENLMLEDISYE